MYGSSVYISGRGFRRGSKTAFTLIELLIIIAIIGLLAAILFPVFARARENARRSSCQSNLEQLALGVMQYATDFDETYPLLTRDKTRNGSFQGGYNTDASSAYYSWPDRIMPYVKSKQLFYCPTIVGGKTYCHYGMNLFLTRGANTDLPGLTEIDETRTFNLAAVQRASEVIMMGDHRFARTGGVEITGSWTYHVDANGTAYPMVRIITPHSTACTTTDSNCLYAPVGTRHLHGTNFAYLDGHVKWMPIPMNSAQTDVAPYGAVNSGNTNYKMVNWNNYATARQYWAPHR